MMNDFKSISQIAQDLGVTRQTIYNKLKTESLATAVNPHIVKQGNYTFYDLQAQKLIKQAVCGETSNDDLTKCKAGLDKVSSNLTLCKSSFDTLSNELETKEQKISELIAIIDDFKAKNESVKAELTKCKDLLKERDKNIDELTAQLLDKEKKLDEYKHKVSAFTEFNTIHNKEIDRLEKENNKLNERLDKAETERTGFLNSISDLTIALKAAQALHGMDKQQAVIEFKEPAERVQSEQLRKASLFSRLFRRK